MKFLKPFGENGRQKANLKVLNGKNIDDKNGINKMNSGSHQQAVWQNGGFSAKFNGSSSIELLCKTEHLCFNFRHFAKPRTVGSNGNGRHYQDQTDRKNEQTMTQDKDLIFAQHTFFCFSATAQVAHLVLPDTQRQRFAKPKEPLFSNALNTAFQNFTNFATK